MDPNANLLEQEHLFTKYGPWSYDWPHAARVELAERRFALEVWLVNGGFEPDWTKATRARVHFGR